MNVKHGNSKRNNDQLNINRNKNRCVNFFIHLWWASKNLCLKEKLPSNLFKSNCSVIRLLLSCFTFTFTFTGHGLNSINRWTLHKVSIEQLFFQRNFCFELPIASVFLNFSGSGSIRFAGIRLNWGEMLKNPLSNVCYCSQDFSKLFLGRFRRVMRKNI